MRRADKLIHILEQNGWESARIDSDDFLLEIHPVHQMQEAGFTLWRRQTGERLDLVTSGHTYDGELVSGENHALDLSDSVLDTLDQLLER